MYSYFILCIKELLFHSNRWQKWVTKTKIWFQEDLIPFISRMTEKQSPKHSYSAVPQHCESPHWSFHLNVLKVLQAAPLSILLLPKYLALVQAPAETRGFPLSPILSVHCRQALRLSVLRDHTLSWDHTSGPGLDSNQRKSWIYKSEHHSSVYSLNFMLCSI